MLVNENVAVSISQDQTIFIFTILQSSNGISLEPVGFIPVDTFIQQIVCVAWEAEMVFWKKLRYLIHDLIASAPIKCHNCIANFVENARHRWIGWCTCPNLNDESNQK